MIDAKRKGKKPPKPAPKPKENVVDLASVLPPGRHPTRKVRVLTEMLIEYFKRNPNLWGLDG
jgi:hypothetical protein